MHRNDKLETPHRTNHNLSFDWQPEVPPPRFSIIITESFPRKTRPPPSENSPYQPTAQGAQTLKQPKKTLFTHLFWNIITRCDWPPPFWYNIITRRDWSTISRYYITRIRDWTSGFFTREPVWVCTCVQCSGRIPSFRALLKVRTAVIFTSERRYISGRREVGRPPRYEHPVNATVQTVARKLNLIF